MVPFAAENENGFNNDALLTKSFKCKGRFLDALICNWALIFFAQELQYIKMENRNLYWANYVT